MQTDDIGVAHGITDGTAEGHLRLELMDIGQSRRWVEPPDLHEAKGPAIGQAYADLAETDNREGLAGDFIAAES